MKKEGEGMVQDLEYRRQKQDGITYNHVSFDYGDTKILQDIDFHIPRGTLSIIVGPNGAGKTTLLRLAAGLLEPTEGTILIDDISPLKAQKSGLLHIVPQLYNKNAAQFPATVEEVVGLALRDAKDRRERIEEALQLVGMIEFRHRLIGELSGGQQQRVMIGQALARKAQYIFLDEPTSGIDFRASEHIYEVLRDVKEQGITVVIVTHDIQEASRVADLACCVNHHLCYVGPCEGFMETHMGTALSWHIGG